MERQLRINWPAIVEEAKQRRKAQKLTQARLATLAEVSTPTVSNFESGTETIELATALKILGVLGMVDKRILIFPEPIAQEDWNKGAIVFWGKDSDKRVRCAISREALGDHFKGDGKNLLKVFEANRPAIEQYARRKYLANQLEADGTIAAELLIRTDDI